MTSDYGVIQSIFLPQRAGQCERCGMLHFTPGDLSHCCQSREMGMVSSPRSARAVVRSLGQFSDEVFAESPALRIVDIYANGDEIECVAEEVSNGIGNRRPQRIDEKVLKTDYALTRKRG